MWDHRGYLPSSWSWPEPSSSSPPPPSRSDWGWSPQWWSLPHIEKWQKLFLRWGLHNTSFLCLLMLLLGLNFLLHALQANTWPLWCQIFSWLGIGKDLKALSQTLHGWTLPLPPSYEFPHKPAIDTCRSRCPQMSNPLHVLLKADAADGKADPSTCLQLNQVSVLQHFLGTGGSMDHQ